MKNKNADIPAGVGVLHFDRSRLSRLLNGVASANIKEDERNVANRDQAKAHQAKAHQARIQRRIATKATFNTVTRNFGTHLGEL